jgi:membrane associated rhomboid family serine protease
LFSGIILWIIGRESWHIGASGLIYALAFFLFFSGLIRRHIPLIAISLIITFLYGSMVWHIFPWKVNDPISWEGHLSGGFTGLMLAVFFRNQGPQRPIHEWEDEEEEDDENENKEFDTEIYTDENQQPGH